MSIRSAFAASLALLALAALTAPASALQTIQLPDPNAPNSNNYAPPDGMFDNSFPDHWTKKTDGNQQQNQNTSGFHFTMSSSNGFGGTSSFSSSNGFSDGNNMNSQSPSATDSAKQAGSEFSQPGYHDPLFDH